MAGMKVQVVEVDKDGNIDMAHLKALVRAGPVSSDWFLSLTHAYEGPKLLCNVASGPEGHTSA